MKIIKDYINFKYILYFLGVKLKYIKDDKETLEKIGQLRKQVFVERKYVSVEDVPDIWLDKYDQEAINFYATKKDEIIGVVRVVKKRENLSLPIETLFNLKDPIQEGYAEVSKLAVHSRYRGGKRLVFIGLMQEISKYCKKNNIPNLTMFMPEWLFGSIKKLGVDIKLLQHNDLTDKETKARHVMRQYFNKQTVKPYTFKF